MRTRDAFERQPPRIRFDAWQRISWRVPFCPCGGAGSSPHFQVDIVEVHEGTEFDSLGCDPEARAVWHHSLNRAAADRHPTLSDFNSVSFQGRPPMLHGAKQ